MSGTGAVERIAARIGARYHEAADTVFMDGSSPWEVDEAMEAFGFAIGPFASQDVTGLDEALAERRRWLAAQAAGRRVIPLLDRMVELGKLGRKTGAGWYRYPGGGGRVDDPVVADLALEECHFEGRTRTDYGEDEIRERLLLAMIDEAALAHRDEPDAAPAAVDRACVERLGFPAARGGPLRLADTLGLRHVADRLAALSGENCAVWRAAPLLARRAAADRTFHDRAAPCSTI